MATVKKVGIDELVQDDKNFNKGTKRGEELMRGIRTQKISLLRMSRREK